MADELCDQESERHSQSLLHLRGFPGSRPLPEHHRPAPGRTEMDGHDPEMLIESYLDQGYIEVDLDGRYLHDIKIVGFRLFVRVQE